MGTLSVRLVWCVAIALVSVAWAGVAHSAVWKTLTSQPVSGGGGTAVIEDCNLLTDGTVVCHETGTNQWHRLRPDVNGSYLNGTWDAAGVTVPAMPNGTDTRLQGYNNTTGTLTGVTCNPCTYAPRFFVSAVLADGRMIVIGGEFDSTSAVSQVLGLDGVGRPITQVETNIGFVFDPVAGSWGGQLTETAFGSGNVGDSTGLVLQDKRFVLADISTGNVEAYNPTTGGFTVLNPTGKVVGDRNNEEGWSLLPDGTVLTVDAFVSSVYEIFNPSITPFPTWTHPGTASPSTVGNMPVNLADLGGVGTSTRSASFEVGPAVLRPDGRLVYFSASEAGQNAVFDTATATWSHVADMDFPSTPGVQFSVPDGPAALLPNGDVLVLASRMGSVDCNADGSVPVGFTICGTFNASSRVYRFSYNLSTGSTLTLLPEQPVNAPSIISFEGRMLVLPTGEILFTTQDVATAQIYSNGEVPQDAWRPTITVGPAQVNPGSSNNMLSGTLFNGLSQGSGYGDDSQSYTNYPLVRITNLGTGHVTYARTHDHSRMGVEAVGSTEIVSTQFDVPGTTELGASCLAVVVNGIASACKAVVVSNNHPPVARCKAFTATASGVCLGSFALTDIDNGSSDPDGDALTRTFTPTGPFGLGPHAVTLTVTDTSGASNSCTATVTVIDTTPPTLTAPANKSVATCATSTTVQVGQATAVDNCAAPLSPTGQVVARNGVPLSPPIAVTGGQVNLGLGTFTVRWTVSDGANPPVTANETVVVGGNMQASQSFLVDDRGQVQSSSGGFAALLNSGTGLTQVGNDGRSGGILSVGAVSVQHRAIVSGSVVSASTVSKASDGTITGSITAGGSVVLPAAPTLPAFPPATLGGFTVNSGVTQTRPPGSYTTVTVINGGTLILNAGDYFFQTLTINAGSIVRVRPTTRVFVRDGLVFNASLLAASGTGIQAAFLGFAGTPTLDLNARFDGTLIAPNTTVHFGSGSALTFTGSFFGRVLEVTPGSTLICRVN